MYFNTIGQGLIFLYLFLIGIGAGIIVTISFVLRSCFKHNYLITLILDILTTIICSLLYYFSVVYLYDGILQWFTIVAYLLGMILQQKTIGKLVAKLVNLVYNTSIKLLTKFKTTRIGKVITK